MELIKVIIIYPDEFNIDRKDFQLNQIELSGLLASNKVNSEGKYFSIKDKIFEYTKYGGQLTIILI